MLQRFERSVAADDEVGEVARVKVVTPLSGRGGSVAVGRRNWLFTGPLAGGEREHEITDLRYSTERGSAVSIVKPLECELQST